MVFLIVGIAFLIICVSAVAVRGQFKLEAVQRDVTALRALIGSAEVSLMDIIDADGLWVPGFNTEPKVMAHNRSVEVIRKYVKRKFTEEEKSFYKNFKDMYISMLEESDD